ncbi:MAG: hypothetical protein ACI86S_000082 [Paracoccaceae bacterium]|jgi:hypothetical protein
MPQLAPSSYHDFPHLERSNKLVWNVPSGVNRVKQRRHPKQFSTEKPVLIEAFAFADFTHLEMTLALLMQTQQAVSAVKAYTSVQIFGLCLFNIEIYLETRTTW